jgi:hypothetical protein
MEDGVEKADSWYREFYNVIVGTTILAATEAVREYGNKRNAPANLVKEVVYKVNNRGLELHRLIHPDTEFPGVTQKHFPILELSLKEWGPHLSKEKLCREWISGANPKYPNLDEPLKPPRLDGLDETRRLTSCREDDSTGLIPTATKPTGAVTPNFKHC